MEKIDIKTGFLCNNNCLFCVQAHNKLKGNRSFEDISYNLKEGIKMGCETAVFTGGETTIRKDFFDLLSEAKKTGYRYVQLQTNGRMFSYPAFCRQALNSGLNQVLISIHGYCAEQHDALTRAPGSFSQTIQGIKNLVSLGMLVMTNVVITRQNYKDLEKIAKMLVEIKVHQFQLAMPHPLGNAMKNFDEVIPKFSEISEHVKNALQIGKDAKISVMVETIPPCTIRGYEDCIADDIIPPTMIRGAKTQDTDNFNYLLKLDKFKAEKCKTCKHDNVCQGPWKEYTEKWGSDELNPI